MYEVKAKSIDSTTDTLTNSKGIAGKWKLYVYDAVFQKYVIRNAYPAYQVNAYLMLADKSKRASTDGLNQKFLIRKDERNRTSVKIVGDVSPFALGDEILCRINVDDLYDSLMTDKPLFEEDPRSFKQWIQTYADCYQDDTLLQAKLAARCGKCEFQASPEQENAGLISGFKACWKRVAHFADDDFARAHILDLWDFKKKDQYIAERKFFLKEIVRSDLEALKPKPDLEARLSRVDRQEMQVLKSCEEKPDLHFDHENLRQVFDQLRYPLHFIDFETSAVAIPFTTGRRPYEQIAFQFSHHLMHADGRIEHVGQWLDTERGRFPNFEFLRRLKADLERDNGSIFRYSNHENTILNAIHRQLRRSADPDTDQLCDWIETITRSSGDSATVWRGERNMIDLWDWVKRYFYAPETNGSNSIKDVLPAILNGSSFLQKKYSQPIYGAEIPSLNFREHTWIRFDEAGRVINPYKQLPPIFAGVDESLLDELLMDEEADLNDGGAAMMAYAQVQFSEMQEPELQRVRESLLRYCELDTLAMVMIVEDWKNRLEG